MIIEKIIIKSFGVITDMTLEFSESVNVIEGQNEIGKSTIAAFIRYMLYGFPDGDSESSLSERKKRINWETGVAQGSMYVRVNKKRYLITRSTVPTDNSARATYKEETSIVDLETGAPAFGKLAAGDVFFGVDRELFDNTAFIGQIGDTAIDEGAVRQSIENILFSGSEKINNERAAARIFDKMEALLREDEKGGVILDIADRQEGLEEQLKVCEEDNRRILEREAELHRIRVRRAEAEASLEKLHDLDTCYGNVMLIQTFDQLHALEEECEEKTEAYNAFIRDNTRQGFVPDQQYLTDLTASRLGVGEAYHSLGDAQDAYTEQKKAVGITKEIEGAIAVSDSLGGEKAVLEAAKGHGKKRALSIFLTSLLGAVSLGGLVLALIIATPWLKITAGVLAGCAALGAGWFGIEIYRSAKALKTLARRFGTEGLADLRGKIGIIGEARTKRDAMAVASENARLAVLKARERYEASKKTLISLIVKWGAEPPTSELGVFLDALEGEVREFLDKKNELYDEKCNIEITVRELRRTLADKSEIDVRGQVSPMKRKALTGMKYETIKTGIADQKARIEEEDRLAFDVENELSMLKGRSGDPGEFYSRIQSLDRRKQELLEKHHAFFIALEAIRSASDALRAEISPRLGEYATRMMEIMTDKKYTSFDVSDGLKVSFVDATGEKKSVDFLSGGTRDMAYIAVRAALIDMLYTLEKPPVCFDESFAHQDNVRARSMMKAIKQLADEGCQSFIFTCRGRESALAMEIVKNAGVFKLSPVE